VIVGFLKIGDESVHFIEGEADGSAVLFIHGSCGAGSQWTSLARHLVGRYRTFQIDLPGCGQNKPWSAGVEWVPAIDTRAIDAMISHIETDVHVVLHSAGGHLAFQSLVNNQEKILSLTMFEPTFFNLLRHHDSDNFDRVDFMARTFQRLVDDGDINAAMESFVDFWAKKAGTWVGFPSAIRNAMRDSANRLYFEWNNIYGSMPTIADLNGIESPVLLVKGTETIGPMHSVCNLIRSEVSNVDYLEVEGAGHMCPFTHHNTVSTTLLAHFGKAG
jgi:pimeloyl-ACP methyl ester carboxylesterase